MAPNRLEGDKKEPGGDEMRGEKITRGKNEGRNKRGV